MVNLLAGGSSTITVRPRNATLHQEELYRKCP